MFLLCKVVTLINFVFKTFVLFSGILNTEMGLSAAAGLIW